MVRIGVSQSLQSPHYHTLVTTSDDETLTIITNDAIIGVKPRSRRICRFRMWKRTFNGGGDLSLWSGSMQTCQ